MIKYFSYETYYIDDELIIKSESILDERPDTNVYGWSISKGDGVCVNIIDIEKYTNYSGELDYISKDVYERLLIQQRNKKMETILE